MNKSKSGLQLVDTPSWVEGMMDMETGPIPRVAATLRFGDRLGSFLARLGVGRMHYSVEPGLYAVGSPTADSPVLVSANYKLSFDHLRRELAGLDVWLLVLDTKGINVWCAAGKGTFGTEEIVKRLKETRLAEFISHRKLIVPQLGATGVAAHEVKKRSGFHVIYGPVRASDIPAFLAAGMKASPEMRRVRFDLRDRAIVVPVEIVHWGKYLLLFAAVMFLLSGLGAGDYAFSRALDRGPRVIFLLFAAFLGGCVVTPLLLPWLPGKAFSLKGSIVGLVLAGLAWIPLAGSMGLKEISAWIFIIPTISAFLALNFTGSTTYTSLSGVRREMRLAIPVELTAGIIGLGLWFAARLF